MITTGQIETKTQYAQKRKEFRQSHYLAGSSLYKGKHNFIQNNSIQKPLQGNVQTHISFKGFNFNIASNLLKPIIKPVPQKLTERTFKTLKAVSKTQLEYYNNIRKNYVDFIKLHTDEPANETEKIRRQIAASYRKANGITDEIAQNITEDNLYFLPQKTVLANFAQQLIAPFTFLYKNTKKIFINKNTIKAQQVAYKEKVLKEFASLQGLLKSHEIWERGYRKLCKQPKWTEKDKFIIPDDVLIDKLQRRRNKVVDPNKGKYSSTSLMLGNRLISGIIYSYFLGTDAYNTTMRYSNNKQEASAQRTSRVAQEFSRIGMNMYIQNLLFGTFEKAVNRSLPTAMFVSGSTVAFSEILGRKLVGKPIMPSDKDTLDRLEKEMYEKKGILPAIGRLLTNVKKKDTSTNTKTDTTLSVSYKKTQSARETFKSFAANNKENSQPDTPLKPDNFNNRPSFKGYYKVDYIFDKNKLSSIIKIIEKADKQTAETLKKAVVKSVTKNKIYKNQVSQIPKSFDEIVSSKTNTNIPVGSKKTTWGLWTTSILVPVRFVKNLFVKSYKNLQKIYNIMAGKNEDEFTKELIKISKKETQKDIERFNSFEKFAQKRLKLDAWQKSPLNDEEKRARLYREFCEIESKEQENIEGAKNFLLWMDKQLQKENIKLNEDGTIDEKSLQKVSDILKNSVLKADNAKHVEYDGNTLAQTNINLSRAITTLFLMTDAYNLTMQYSNDNRKDAAKSAKNRAAQEISRISVSAYMLAFVHNLLSKLCNSSLAGAFTLTALTSSINDSISRQVVGVPLRAKSQDELIELDKKNARSKSPIKKALAYSIGKKTSSGNTQKQITNTSDTKNNFNEDFFLTPEIK